MATIRVVVVDDHEIFRHGVSASLGRDIEVAGEAGAVADAIRAVEETQPDVVLLDVHLPDGSGAKVVTDARVLSPRTKFLALSVSDAAEDVVAVIRAGARGYLTKGAAPDQVRAAVQTVAGGDVIFSPRLAGFVLDAFAQPTPSQNFEARNEMSASLDDLNTLTKREREVMRLIARGRTYREVAEELFLSVKTVESHVSNVLRKLQLTSRYELAAWAHERRML